jgi:putative (di)nucleoside polyphosphate hydrolase
MSARLYRPCVGIALINHQGGVFIGRRSAASITDPTDEAYAWQLPQGGIDDGETPLEAAHRELYEETNVRTVSLLMESPEWFSYDLPPAILERSWKGRNSKGRFVGQTQKWFAFRFEGKESEINVARPAEGAHRPEFSAWRWEKIDALPDLVIPFKKDVYNRVVASFRHLCETG